MIRSVEFSGASENPYKIQLVRPSADSLIIQDMDGLGAGKADLHISPRASLDGDLFNGARVPSRNITMKLGSGLGLDPEDGRDIAYDILPIKQPVSLVFETSKKLVMIEGIVESHDPSIFTKEPALDISLRCIFPHFRSVDEDRTTIRMYSLENKFEFPFSNESLDEDLIEMGEHVLNQFVELRYTGTETTGMLIRFMFRAPTTNPSVYSERTDQTTRILSSKIRVGSTYGIQAGDIIEVDSVRGQRSIWLIRDHRRTKQLDALAPTSTWIELKKGINPISIQADSGINTFQTELIFDRYYAGI